MNWFIIHKNEHLGPFSEEVLAHLYEEGEITGESHVWREGLESSILYVEAFSEIVGLTKVIDQVKADSHSPDEDLHLPPDLPIEVVEESVLNKLNSIIKVEAQAAEEALAKEAAAPVSRAVNDILEASINNQKKSSEKIIKEVKIEVNAEIAEEVKELKKERSYKWIFALAGMLLFIGLCTGGWMYFSSHFMSFTRPSMMSLKDFGKLSEIGKDTSADNLFKVSFSKDKSKIWFGTNIVYEGEVFLKIKSLSDEILSNEPVEAEAVGTIKNKLITFSEFSFLKGRKFIDGRYDVEIYTSKALTVPLVAKIMTKRKRQFRFFDQVLISSFSRVKFQKTLDQYLAKNRINDTAFWEELQQKYETLKVITIQIQDAIEEVFKNPKLDWRKRVTVFEDNYKTKYGNFFTTFVIANEQSYSKLKSKEFSNKLEIISNYTRLSRLSKNVGLITMDILHELESVDAAKTNKNGMANLKKSSLGKLKGIIDICNEKVKFIQNR